jgi:uncharacterized BrkB/YihY/UPF0761 family membrane protein
MRFLLAYLLITLLVGVVVKLLTVAAREDVGILYERKYWNNGYDDIYVTIVLTYAYIVTFSFAICYWIYKLCTRRKN